MQKGAGEVVKEGKRAKVTKVAKVTNGKESANKGKGD